MTSNILLWRQSMGMSLIIFAETIDHTMELSSIESNI